MLLAKHIVELSNLKDRLEAGEISTNEYNELCAKLSDNFKAAERAQWERQGEDIKKQLNSYRTADGKKNKYELNEVSEFVSNCCGASIWQPDHNGHGNCSDCGENCTPEEEEDEETIVNTMGRLFDAVGGYFADTWEAEEEDYYLSRYDESNL
jgi:hypothetical protein